MKIQCKLERPNGSEITFDHCDRWPAGHYHFKPDPNVPGSPHLAEVTDERHINRFLSIGDSFRVHLDSSEQPKRPDTPAKGDDTDGDGTGGVVLPPKTPENSTVDPARVAQIRDLTIKDLKAQINTYTADELKAALEGEKARTDDAPRKGWIEVVVAHLGTPT